MKRIVYIATMVALLATACQKTDVLNVAEDSIEFDTQVGKLTKADEYDKLGTLKTQGFRVWAVADFTLGTDTDGEIYRGMNGLLVKPTDTGWGYAETSQKYFWPAAGKYLYFYTLSANDDNWLKSVSYNTHFTKATEVTGLDLPIFTVTDEANDDVMVADHIRQDKVSEPNKKVVKPQFRHTMTKVEFNFRQGIAGTLETSASEATNVILKAIEIGGYEGATGLVFKGNLDVTYGFEDASNTTPFKWTPSVTETDIKSFSKIPTALHTIVKKGGAIVPVLTEAPATAKENDLYVEETTDGRNIMKYVGSAWVLAETHVKGTDGVWVASLGEGQEAEYETFVGEKLEAVESYDNFVTWYMIPQTLGDKTVKISYVADGKHLDQEFKLSGTTTTPITWTEEKCVKYNVTIAPHKIEFNPTVGEWDKFGATTENPDGTDIDMNN